MHWGADMNGFEKCAAFAGRCGLAVALLSEGNDAIATQEFPATYFGAHVHRSVPNQLWKQVGFGAIRLHDANVTWAELEPRQGEWKWDRLDRIVKNARQAGVEILLPLQATPEWAASDPTSAGAYGPGANTVPARMADWTAYVSAVATRYKGLITTYEIWNEPNLKKFFDGTPEQMAELTRAAATVIRAVDPQAQLVCSSITGDYGIPWLKRYLARDTGRACDVIGYHFYTKHMPPERMLPVIRAVRDTMNDAGVGAMPLWNTESGWVIGISPDIDVKASGFKADVKILTADEATAYIPRALLLARHSGVERFYWYSWDHPSMGFSAGRGVKWTRPARLYTALRKLVEGARLEGCSSGNGIWTCQVALATGERIGVHWTESGETSFAAPRDGSIYGVSSDGEIEIVGSVRAGESVHVGPTPVFLRDPS